jgi:two-component system response regulator HydG
MTERARVLVVDDKPNMLRLMTKVLQKEFEVRVAGSGEEAIRHLTSRNVDAVLCDLRMPDMDGLDVLRQTQRLQPRAAFVLMTAYASVGTAVEALKLGAYDYVSKPFDPEEVLLLLRRAVASVQLDPNGSQVPSGTKDSVLPGVIGRSGSMRSLAALVAKVAQSDLTTLILGETGTGKERVARAIHELSPRRAGRLLAINCAAIPPDLLETELFGHAKGAFTGATRERKGLFEEANGGSLFLDEIGDLRPSLQAKLTRVLEERVVRRVGEVQERPIDVRLIAATHRDLELMVKESSFREDLWYRLNVALVEVPPLRARPDDIEQLAQYFLSESAARSPHLKARGFSAEAKLALERFDWPGNVRQLRSAVERATVLSAGEEIQVEDLPRELQPTSEKDVGFELSSLTWAEAMERGRLELGKRYLTEVLRASCGRVAEAARSAGVERESFYRLLRRHEVDPVSFRNGMDEEREE